MSLVLELLLLSQSLKILNRISMRYSRDAYSFQVGMQLLMWGEKWIYSGGLGR